MSQLDISIFYSHLISLLLLLYMFSHFAVIILINFYYNHKIRNITENQDESFSIDSNNIIILNKILE